MAQFTEVYGSNPDKPSPLEQASIAVRNESLAKNSYAI
jgi:hypothetical protein